MEQYYIPIAKGKDEPNFGANGVHKDDNEAYIAYEAEKIVEFAERRDKIAPILRTTLADAFYRDKATLIAANKKVITKAVQHIRGNIGFVVKNNISYDLADD